MSRLGEGASVSLDEELRLLPEVLRDCLELPEVDARLLGEAGGCLLVVNLELLFLLVSFECVLD